jgi:hypothetical protein
MQASIQRGDLHSIRELNTDLTYRLRVLFFATRFAFST